MTEGTQFCISCGEIFDPANPDVLLCPACGGPPEALLAAPVVLTEMPRVELQPSGEPGTGSDWQPGEVILDTYEVKAVLGQGGFGKVYRVHHRAWNVYLAVKRSLNLEESSKQAFIEEAEKWINLGLHPHIVSCYYVRNIDGFPHTFAELAEGGSLKDWIEGEERKLYAGGSAVALERILDIVIQFAWGLGYAHEQGLVHQDVKPGNVLMTPDGVAKVTDFGLAKARRLPPGSDHAVGGIGVLVSTAGGTQAFRSPEQAHRDRLSIHTDIWSWAVSILEMFAGEIFWQYGEAAAEVLEGFSEEGAQVPGPPPMPKALAELLRNCFQHEPSERPKDMLVIAGRLQAIYQQETGQAYSRPMPKAVNLRADSLNNKALSLLELGKKEEAMVAWTVALKLDPHHPGATYNQSLVQWRDAGITDETILTRMQEIRSSHPDDWLLAYLSSLVQIERRDYSAAFEELNNIKSPDAGRLEVLTVSNQLNGWLANSKPLSRNFVGHTFIVESVCLSLDGCFALSGSDDSTIKLWEVESGRCLRTLEGHTSGVQSVCLSFDGRHALSGSLDTTLKWWDIENGHCLHTLKGHTKAVRSICLSADGRSALSGSDDKTLKLWDVESGCCLRTFEGHLDSVNSVCLSADGSYALSGGDNVHSGGKLWSRRGELKLWEVASGRCLRTFGGNVEGVESVCLSTDGRFALVGGSDLGVYDVASGDRLRTFTGHTGEVLSVFLSADGRYALSGGAGVKLWEAESGRCLGGFNELNAVESVFLSADGRYVIAGDQYQNIKLWVLQLGMNQPAMPFWLSRIQVTQDLLSSQVIFEQAFTQALHFIENGQPAAAAKHPRRARSQPGYERAANILDLWFRLYSCLPRRSFQAGWETGAFDEYTNPVRAAAMSKDGNYVLSTGRSDARLTLWELPSGRILRIFNEPHNAVDAISMSSNGRYALSGSSEGEFKLWELPGGRCLHTFKGYKYNINCPMCLSVNGRYALIAESACALMLLDVETGHCLRTFTGHTDSVLSAYISGDGCYVLSGSSDKTLKLWELASGRCLRTFEGHMDFVSSVCLSTDGCYALSGSSDKTLKLWELASGRCLRTLEGHNTGVSSVCLSFDGRYALSGSGDKTVKLWELSSGRCLRTFEGHSVRIRSVHISADGRYALSLDSYSFYEDGGGTLKLWALDWDFEDKEPVDWDDDARPYLEIFLTQQTPFAVPQSEDCEPIEEEIILALTRRGKPTWSEEDFQRLLYTLGCAGYGWLRPEGVRRRLEELAAGRK